MKIPWMEAALVGGVYLCGFGLAEQSEHGCQRTDTSVLIGLGVACLAAGGLEYDARRRAERNMADIRAGMEARRKLHGSPPAADAVER